MAISSQKTSQPSPNDGPVVFRCRRCTAPLTGELQRATTGNSFRFDATRRRVVVVAPLLGFYSRWDEHAATIREPYGEPVREDIDGWYIVRSEDVVHDLIHVADYGSR